MLEKSSPEYAVRSSSQETIVETSSSPKRYHGTGDAFVSGGATELYEPIPEYEGRHRYDPSAEWTEKEEKVLVRKVRFS
jgi:hypothetical protein